MSAENVKVVRLCDADIAEAVRIWNEVVDDGLAFPQIEGLTIENAGAFFAEQTYTGVAKDEQAGKVLGLYILHPNNIGRCGHISNTSYAVASEERGRGIGELLVRDSLEKAKEYGFGVMQFNAVVATNEPALALYKKVGFTQLGVIPKGFLQKDGSYVDIIPHYYELV